MKSLPTDFDTGTKPLPAEGLGSREAAAIAELKAKGYSVVRGLTLGYLAEIQKLASQPAMREYTPKDLTERFADVQTARQWLSKGRAMYLLLKESNDSLELAGYGWAGPGGSSHVPAGKNTFAIRLGAIGQGQSLAAPFSWLILATSAVEYGTRDYWLETWQSNGAAVHVYHKIGFTDISSADAQRPTASGGLVADKRLFMSLANELLPG